MKVIYIIALFIYLSCLFFIFLYSLIQLHLSIKYHSKPKKPVNKKNISDSELPMVTVQLPVYNEQYVVERLLDCIAQLDYPENKLQIQLLDDSTDESFEIAAGKIETITANSGIEIEHISRPIREGFKAGALQYGLQTAIGEFICVFDADFLPRPSFIKDLLPYFDHDKIGMVQARWEHINEDYSVLTKTLAFQLNAHFSVEQKGRNNANYCMNFNGTAGIWRKETISDAGGWQADTITEDLDLSYRAQLKGWQFRYVEDITAPAELPAAMSAIKSQQHRWTKGGAETARKHFGNIISSKLGLLEKFHSIAHLANSFIFVCVLGASLSSVLVLLLKNNFKQFDYVLTISIFGFVPFFILIIFYTSMLNIRKEKGVERFLYFAKMFPTFICLSMGIALHNSIAALQGFLGKKSAFIRTPKFNLIGSGYPWFSNSYLNKRLDISTWLELLMCLILVSALIFAILEQDFGFFIFHSVLLIGYCIVLGYSIVQQLKLSARN